MGMKRLLWVLIPVTLLIVGFATDAVRLNGWAGRWFEGTSAIAGPTKADETAGRLASLQAQFDGLRDAHLRLASQAIGHSASADIEREQLRKAVAFLLEEAADPGPDYAAMQRSTVRVVLPKGHGSGVILAPRLVLTSAHVVDGDDPIKVEFHDGTKMDAEVAWIGQGGAKADIAALRLSEDAPLPPAVSSCRHPGEGERLIAVGNPRSGRAVSSLLRVASLRPWHERIPASIVIQGAMVGGMSGGPVFDMQGRVVAINHAFFGQPIGFGASITGFGAVFPLAAICDALPMVERAEAAE